MICEIISPKCCWNWNVSIHFICTDSEATLTLPTNPPIDALLTNLKGFYFLRYDGTKFTLYEKKIIVSSRSRSSFLDRMRYISTLDAIVSSELARVVSSQL